MSKTGDSAIRMTRKGVMIWIGLMLFVAGWMFVLGILVGRGMAPVNLDTGKLEQELAALKARMLRQEQAKVETGAQGPNGAKTELGFYEALKDPKAEKPFQPMPKSAVQPESWSVPKPPVTAVPMPKQAPKPEPKPEPKPVVKPPPSPKMQASRASGKFTVQVAAFKDLQSATHLVAELRKKGYRAYQIRTEVAGKGVWYRVRVGAFTDSAGAREVAGKLKGDKYGAMVVTTQ